MLSVNINFILSDSNLDYVPLTLKTKISVSQAGLSDCIGYWYWVYNILVYWVFLIHVSYYLGKKFIALLIKGCFMDKIIQLTCPWQSWYLVLPSLTFSNALMSLSMHSHCDWRYDSVSLELPNFSAIFFSPAIHVAHSRLCHCFNLDIEI